MSQNPQQRNAHFEELQRMDAQLRDARNIDALKPVYFRLEELTQAYAHDPQMQNAIAAVRNNMVAHGQRLVELQNTAERQAASGGGPFPQGAQPQQPIIHPGVATAVRTPSSEFPVPPAQPPSMPPPPGGAVPPAPAAAFNWKRAIAVGGFIGALIAAGGIYTVHMAKKRAEEKKDVVPGALSVAVKTVPAGASIRVNGEVKCTSDCQIELAPGSYEVQAVLPGYESASSALNVVEGSPSQVALTLQPLALSVRLFTDLQAGKVTLDGNAIGDLQDGQLVLDRVSPGKHAVKIANGATEASFEFESQPGQAPVISGPVTAKNVLAILFANAGKSARLHSSAKLKVQVDGQPAGDAGPEGVALPDLAPGDRELAVNDGSIDRKLLLSVGVQPTLTAYLKLDLNAGSLLVSTGDIDDATVFLNNTQLQRKTKGGQLRLPGLPVRQYQVRVVKDGYTVDGPKTVSIAKGQEARLEFALKAVPKLATLRIRGAAPGIAVVLDRDPIGTIGADGTLTLSTVSPGEHTVELRRDKFAPKRVPRQFRAGETVEISGNDVALAAAGSTVRVNVKPANAQIFYKRSDDPQTHTATGNSLSLTEGTWTITAKAANFADASQTIQVAAGESKTVELSLNPAPKVAAKRAGTMVDWEQAGEWVPQGAWSTHKGGNYVLYGITPVNGTFTFNLALLKGKRLQWFVNYVDSKNYVLFQLDKKNFYRRDVVNGRSSEFKRAHELDKQESYTMQIDVTPTTVRHQLHDGARWVEIDSFSTSSQNLSLGKFGLYIPGNDVFGLSNFRYNPR